MIVITMRWMHKAFIILFTSCMLRAVIPDLIEHNIIKNFINSIKMFIAGRGCPKNTGKPVLLSRTGNNVEV